MNGKVSAVLASFETIEAVSAAANGLRQTGLQHATVYSPVYAEELHGEAAVGESRIGFLSLAGAIIGAAAGLLLTIGTSMQWPLMTGGQPIISLPPFFVISFELTILLGVVATVLGMLWGIRRSITKTGSYHSRFSGDRFGIQVICDESQVASVKNLVSSAGAEEVRDEKL